MNREYCSIPVSGWNKHTENDTDFSISVFELNIGLKLEEKPVRKIEQNFFIIYWKYEF